MKTTSIRASLCLSLLLFLSLTARSAPLRTDEPTGITFFKGSWKDVLAEAKRQNKPVFVDIYTSWCPPCKRMAKEAFPNPKIGTKFNVHFINYQLNAEQGEGVQVAKQYAVASYPTALYIAPNGTLVHRAVGYSGLNGMIDQADHMLALPILRMTIAKGDRDYVSGKRDPAFLKKYLLARQGLNRPTSDVLDAYLDALPESERLTPETMSFVAKSIQSSTTKAFDYLIKNRPDSLSSDPIQQSLATTVSNALNRVLDLDFKQVIATSDELLLETVIANSERILASATPSLIREETHKQEAANRFRLVFLQQTQLMAK